jgi:hypothetical protein
LTAVRTAKNSAITSTPANRIIRIFAASNMESAPLSAELAESLAYPYGNGARPRKAASRERYAV